MTSVLDTKTRRLYVTFMDEVVGSGRASRREQEQDRASWRDATPALLVLAVAFVAMLTINEPGPSPVRLLWVVLNVVGVGLLLRAELRGLRRADEFQRRLQLEALGIGFAATVMLTILAGLLVGAGLSEARPWLTISTVGGFIAWLGARALLTWRSR